MFDIKEFVPEENFGRDHWSTLAYVETRLVDNGKFVIKADDRMRTRGEHQFFLGRHSAGAWQPEWGTRLKDGSRISQHDDWNCVADLLAAGYFMQNPEEVERGASIALSEKGYSVIARIRRHKCKGGSFSDFEL